MEKSKESRRFPYFTDQKQRIATGEECSYSWSGAKNGARFRCYLCGRKFKPGDKWRWVYAQHANVLNFFTCGDCDGDDVIDRFIAHCKKWKEITKGYWWKNGRTDG